AKYFCFEPTMDRSCPGAGHQAVEQSPLTPWIAEICDPPDGRNLFFQSRTNEMHAVGWPCGHHHPDLVVADKPFQKLRSGSNPETPGIGKKQVAPDPGRDCLKQ